ncbi:hypothetical protein R16034_00860 [Ralstonia edaphis]|uniref:Uncharacterized protein n=1 Tax=Ralstonia edaphi TaxID=3058599 RepID=A0AB72WX79_9RALS|nr:hypothetical protein [Ralstonia sp. LMG 6871]CAJ0737822.1 hypothetical protein R16034_00860 [Ralstonia sp. LMG 6871]
MKIVFDTLGGNFEACREAEYWCEARGIAVGVMERDQPRGLLVGSYHIAKWHNLSGPERRELQGKMTGDMRHGPVTIELVGNEEDYPIIPEEYRA